MKVVKSALIGAGVAAMVAILGTGAAMATPTFTINPNAITGSGYSPVNVSDLNFTSDSLVTQTSATTQEEAGWAIS